MAAITVQVGPDSRNKEAKIGMGFKDPVNVKTCFKRKNDLQLKAPEWSMHTICTREGSKTRAHSMGAM